MARAMYRYNARDVSHALTSLAPHPLSRPIHGIVCILKKLELDQSRKNGYQTVPFSVYIHNLMFSSWCKFSEKSLGTVVILLIATHR